MVAVFQEKSRGGKSAEFAEYSRNYQAFAKNMSFCKKKVCKKIEAQVKSMQCLA